MSRLSIRSVVADGGPSGSQTFRLELSGLVAMPTKYALGPCSSVLNNPDLRRVPLQKRKPGIRTHAVLQGPSQSSSQLSIGDAIPSFH